MAGGRSADAQGAQRLERPGHDPRPLLVPDPAGRGKAVEALVGDGLGFGVLEQPLGAVTATEAESPMGASMLPQAAADASLTLTVPACSRPATFRASAPLRPQTLPLRP